MRVEERHCRARTLPHTLPIPSLRERSQSHKALMRCQQLRVEEAAGSQSVQGTAPSVHIGGFALKVPEFVLEHHHRSVLPA